MPEANLKCVEGCGGTYRYDGSDGDIHTFTCQNCGEALQQTLSPALAAWARALADGGEA